MRTEGPLKLLILDHEPEAKRFFLDILAKVGLTEKRPLKSLLLGVYIMSILDSQRWAWKINSLDSLVKEYWLFVSHVGDIDKELDLFANEEYLETAIEDTEKLVRINDIHRIAFIDTIRLYTDFLLKVPISPPFSVFTKHLSHFVLNKLSITLDEEQYLRKAHFFGRLLVATKSNADPMTIARLALLTFPVADQRQVNFYLFLLFKALCAWNNIPLRYLHCPIDPTFLRVAKRIGLIRGRRPSMRYGGQMYNLVQSIAREVFPEDPSKLYTLRYVGEVYCKPRHMLCDECWLFGVCKTYMTGSP